MNWKLHDLMHEYNRDRNKTGKRLTVKDLVEETGLSTNTLYPIYRGDAQRVDRESLDRLIDAWRVLTDEPIDVGDLLVRE